MRVSLLAILLVLVGCTPVEFTTQCSVAPETCCDLNPDHPACADVSSEASVELDGAPHDTANDALPADSTTGPDGEAPDVSGEDTASPDGTTADAFLDSVVVDSTGIDTGATVDTGADSVTVDTNADTVTADTIAETGATVDTGADTCVKNACGGCTTLTATVGAACGVCTAGKWVCSGTEAVSCSDPFTGTKPGVACGTCKTLLTTCAPDGKSATCPGDDANACGGCGVLANAPGAKCGMCMTSSYACSGTTATTCSKPDDRTSGTDSFSTAYGGGIDKIWETNKVAITFTMQRAGSINALTLSFRAFVSDLALASGKVRVRVIKGTPTLTPAAADVLATVDFETTVMSTVDWVPMKETLATPTAMLPTGQKVWLEISDMSPRYDFDIGGTNATSSPEHVMVFDSADGAWTKRPGVAMPHLEVGIIGCW